MGQSIISRNNPAASGDKIGDIKFTQRELGNEWVKCDGGIIDTSIVSSEYLEMANPIINGQKKVYSTNYERLSQQMKDLYDKQTHSSDSCIYHFETADYKVSLFTYYTALVDTNGDENIQYHKCTIEVNGTIYQNIDLGQAGVDYTSQASNTNTVDNSVVYNRYIKISNNYIGIGSIYCLNAYCYGFDSWSDVSMYSMQFKLSDGTNNIKSYNHMSIPSSDMSLCNSCINISDTIDTFSYVLIIKSTDVTATTDIAGCYVYHVGDAYYTTIDISSIYSDDYMNPSRDDGCSIYENTKALYRFGSYGSIIIDLLIGIGEYTNNLILLNAVSKNVQEISIECESIGYTNEITQMPDGVLNITSNYNNGPDGQVVIQYIYEEDNGSTIVDITKYFENGANTYYEYRGVYASLASNIYGVFLYCIDDSEGKLLFDITNLSREEIVNIISKTSINAIGYHYETAPTDSIDFGDAQSLYWNDSKMLITALYPELDDNAYVKVK